MSIADMYLVALGHESKHCWQKCEALCLVTDRVELSRDLFERAFLLEQPYLLQHKCQRKQCRPRSDCS